MESDPMSPSELSSTQLEELRTLLLTKRADLYRKRARRPEESPESPADPADAASEATTDAEARGLAEHDQRLLKEDRKSVV